MAEICVIGGGPAGSTFAARMAQLGHDVVLLERDRFPRRHLGESLSPGVLPLLDASGARPSIEAAAFPRVRTVQVKWGGATQSREHPREEGLLVDRGEFDQLLLLHAASLGVQVRQPARVQSWRRNNDGRWTVEADCGDSRVRIQADFIADATGRSSRLTGPKRRTACRTVALYAYWRSVCLPPHPCIEAGPDRWYWGVPLPGGWYNTLVFIDQNHFRDTPPRSLRDRFIELIGKSELLRGEGRLIGTVQVADATPFISSDAVGASMIRIGDAALGIDPVSSSGVQKAIQTSLAAAIVANTLVRKPESRNHAMQFYESMLSEASTRHCRWAAEHYNAVSRLHNTAFWGSRSANIHPGQVLSAVAERDPAALQTLRVALSPQAEITEVPCLDDRFVVVKPALRHPRLDGPVTFLAGRELVPLLREVRSGSTLPQVVSGWLHEVPPQAGIAIVRWLLRNEILVGETP